MAWNSLEETALHLAVRENLIDPLKEMLSWNSDNVYGNQAVTKVKLLSNKKSYP